MTTSLQVKQIKSLNKYTTIISVYTMISPYTFFMFKALSLKINMDILVALRDKKAMTHNELLKRFNIPPDSGLLSYYLLQLKNLFLIEKLDNKYQLTFRGHDILKRTNDFSREVAIYNDLHNM